MKTLALAANKIVQLGDLSNLVNLAYLNVASNQVRLCSPLFLIATICHLLMFQLTELPGSIGKCSNLGILDVSHNKLLRLPDTLGACKFLQSLHAHHNDLQTLPPSLKQCPRLMHLVLDHNHLSKFPELLRVCPIRQLSLSHNNITEFSPSLARLNLNRLDVRGNPIKLLPSYMVP